MAHTQFSINFSRASLFINSILWIVAKSNMVWFIKKKLIMSQDKINYGIVYTIYYQCHIISMISSANSN